MGSKQQTIIITGVSTGIGAASARILADAGYHIIGTVRQIKDADPLVDDLDRNFTPVLLDVTKPEQVADAFKVIEQLLTRTPPLIALVNNAGIALGGPLLYLETVILEKQLQVNLLGVHNVTRVVVPLLKPTNPTQSAPCIINISSVAGRRVLPFMGPYSASKHALEAYSDALRLELYPHGIKVVIVEPGPVLSAIWNKVPSAEETPFPGTEYEPALIRFNATLKRKAASALPAESIGKLILKILESSNPRNRYVITQQRWLGFEIFRRLPSRFSDWLLRKYFGLNSSFNKTSKE